MSGTQRDYEHVTRSIEAFRREAAIEQVARLRRDGGADSHTTFASRHAFASSTECHDVLGEALERGLAPAAEVAAYAAHAAEGARARALASVRDTVRVHARKRVVGDRDGLDFVGLVAQLRARPSREEASMGLVSSEAARAEGPIRDAHAEAQRLAGRFMRLAVRRPDAIEAEPVRKRAAAFLDATDDLLAEQRDYLEHRIGAPLTASSVLRVLGAKDLDDAFKPEAFRARMMQLATPLGLAETLARRVRVEPAHGGAGLRTELLYVDPPLDVRVSPSSFVGILGEISLLEGVGRAIAVSLTSPAFSFAHRHPLEGTMPRALGGLFVRTVFDPARLSRERRWPGAVQDASRRLASATTTLVLRLCAAAVLSPATSGEAAEVSVRRALGFGVGEHVAALALVETTQAARLLGGLAAISLFERLRERFDEDFDRNPRTHEAIRGACERGGSISAADALLELGGDVPHARALTAWFHGR